MFNAEAYVIRWSMMGASALEAASKHGKYAFVFFYRKVDARTQQLRAVFNGAVAKLADRAESLSIRVDDPSQKEVVDRFKVRTAPRPFVIVVAPNGVHRSIPGSTHSTP